MTERLDSLTNAAGYTTSNGCDIAQVQDLIFARFGNKGVIWQQKTPDFYADDSDFQIVEPKSLAIDPAESVKAF